MQKTVKSNIDKNLPDIILSSLLNSDKYGFEIIKEIEEKSLGTSTVKQATLYAALKRLLASGHLTSHWEDSNIGGKRRYYSLTEEGKELAEKNKNNINWNEMITPGREQIIDALNAPSDDLIAATTLEQVDLKSLEEIADSSPDSDSMTTAINVLLSKSEEEHEIYLAQQRLDELARLDKVNEEIKKLEEEQRLENERLTALYKEQEEDEETRLRKLAEEAEEERLKELYEQALREAALEHTLNEIDEKNKALLLEEARLAAKEQEIDNAINEKENLLKQKEQEIEDAINKRLENATIKNDISPIISPEREHLNALLKGNNNDTNGFIKNNNETKNIANFETPLKLANTLLVKYDKQNEDYKKLTLSDEEIDAIAEDIKGRKYTTTDVDVDYEYVDGKKYKLTTKTTTYTPAKQKVKTNIHLIDGDDVESLYDVTDDVVLDVINAVQPGAKLGDNVTSSTTVIDGVQIDESTKITVFDVGDGEEINKYDSRFLDDNERFDMKPLNALDKDDAVFVNDTMPFKDIEVATQKKFETKVIEEIKPFENEEAPANNSKLVYDKKNSYVVHPLERSSKTNAEPKRTIKFINLYKLLLTKNIIMAVLVLAEFIIAMVALSGAKMLDYRSGLVLFLTLFPSVILLIASIFKFVYNKDKKRQFRVAPTIFLEVLISCLSVAIMVALVKLFGMKDHVTAPFASWIIFPIFLAFNLIVSALLFHCLKHSKYIKDKSLLDN
jgi:PadR family transcriptional regulator PadR